MSTQQTQTLSTEVPATSPHQQAADTFLTQFRSIAAALPSAQGQPATNARFVRTHQNVSLDFLKAAADALDKVPEVQGACDATFVRDKLSFIDAYGPVASQLFAAASGLQYAVWAAKASLVGGALRTYLFTRRVADDADPLVGPVEAATHVEVMRKALGRRGRKKAATEPPTPAPPTHPPAEKEVPKPE